MEILFLGTGAADWNFDEHYNMEGFRRYSSALIDGELLIDPNPHVFDACEKFGVDTQKIKYIINTHSHGDHYCEETVQKLTNAKFFPLKENEQVTLGKYTVFSYRANHGTCEGAVHFIVTDGQKNLFYGLDSAWLLYDEVAAIKEKGIDYAVFDATIGDCPGDYRIFEHNNLNMVLEMKQTLNPYIKRFCISHLARTLHSSHAQVTERLKPHNVEVAFDGYKTEF